RLRDVLDAIHQSASSGGGRSPRLEGRIDVNARTTMNRFSRLGLIALAGIIAVPAQAQLLTHKDLSLAIATTIAQTAMDSCTGQGYGVSVVVVDRAGGTIVALRGDKAGPITMENARRKAYTALAFRTATSDYAKRYADNNPV